jgi:hypothetical protein
MDKKAPVAEKAGSPIEVPGGKDLDGDDYVEVWTVRPGALHLNTVRLKRRAAKDQVWVRGIVGDIAPPDFTVQGISVTTSASTVFRGLDAVQFFQLLVPGRMVKVQGVLVNSRLSASEVGFDNFGDDEEVHGVV